MKILFGLFYLVGFLLSVFKPGILSHLVYHIQSTYILFMIIQMRIKSLKFFIDFFSIFVLQINPVIADIVPEYER